MFDRIAPSYDLLNRLLSAGTDRRWRRSAVDLLQLAGEARILDLCSGTADLLIEALSRDGRRRGVGTDLSLRMLERAAAKLEVERLSGRSSLSAGDVERLPFATGVFDAATIAFGIRNVGDPERALLEIRRVLKPGGQLIVLEFGVPRGVLGGLFQLYFRHLLPCIGGLVSGDASAYAYLPESVARFPEPRVFTSLLERTGFASVMWQPLTLGIAHLFRGEAAEAREA